MKLETISEVMNLVMICGSIIPKEIVTMEVPVSINEALTLLYQNLLISK